MGKLGWVVGLDRHGAEQHPERVKPALWKALADQWNEMLERGEVRPAIDWLDDVVTFELDDAGFTLLFDLSVGWPVDRGEHWVRLGLALGRHNLDADLAAAGYRIIQRGDAAPFPSLRSELYERSPRCSCALCTSVHDNVALYGVDGYAGHRGEALDRRGSDTVWTYIPSSAGDGSALWLSGDPPRMYATWDDGVRWERVILPLAAERVRATALGPGSFLVGSDTWHRSVDGGLTWDVVAAPPGVCTELRARGDDVLAIVAGALHRSRDGGSTWEQVAASASHAAFAEGDALHVIADGQVVGAAPLPFTAEQILVGRAPGTFMVFGTSPGALPDEPAGARLARTTDGGRTFSIAPARKNVGHQVALAHPSGRWFWVPVDAEFLQFSDDEGLTWTAAADLQPQGLAVDSARERAIYATSWDKVARLSW